MIILYHSLWNGKTWMERDGEERRERDGEKWGWRGRERDMNGESNRERWRGMLSILFRNKYRLCHFQNMCFLYTPTH
jgi:hypothetical protein